VRFQDKEEKELWNNVVVALCKNTTVQQLGVFDPYVIEFADRIVIAQRLRDAA
jgi:hypothetical protein